MTGFEPKQLAILRLLFRRLTTQLLRHNFTGHDQPSGIFYQKNTEKNKTNHYYRKIWNKNKANLNFTCT